MRLVGAMDQSKVRLCPVKRRAAMTFCKVGKVKARSITQEQPASTLGTWPTARVEGMLDSDNT